MNKLQYKKNAMNQINKNHRIIYFTIIYIIFLIVVLTIQYVLALKISLYGILVTSPKRIPFNLFFMIPEMMLFSSYVYMLNNNKLKIKRFFSFFRYKNWKFFLQITLFICIPYEIFNLFFNRFKYENKNIASILAILSLIFSLLRFLFTYFKSVYPNDGIIVISKKIISFFIIKIKEYLILNISFIPWIVAYVIILYVFLVRISCGDGVSIILSSSYGGLGIYLFPYYFLSLKNLVKDENQS